MPVNEPLFRKIVQGFEGEEYKWDQKYWINVGLAEEDLVNRLTQGQDWSCDTAFCIAGLACYLSDRVKVEQVGHAIYTYITDEHDNRSNFAREGRQLLGLSPEQAGQIFEFGSEYTERHPTIDQMKKRITEVTGIVFDNFEEDKS
jgi:hypothetical protein